MEKVKEKQTFHDADGEVHVDFNIGEFLDVRVDKAAGRLTLVARAVTGEPFSVSFRELLERRLGGDASCRILEEAAHGLMKAQVLELLRR